MTDWQIREKHEKECKNVLVDHDALDYHGRIRKWNGMIRLALFMSGHTTLDHSKCVCLSRA